MSGSMTRRRAGSAFTPEEEEGALAHVYLTLDAQGLITGYSASAKPFFKRSRLTNSPFSGLIDTSASTASLRLPTQGETSTSQVVFLARKGRRVNGSVTFHALRRGGHKTLSGYTAAVRLYDVTGFRGLPEGYLQKKAENTLSANRWQKRYFRARKVLHADKPAEYVLDYFTDQTSATVKGSIKLNGTLVTTSFQSLVFEVHGPTHTVRLKANTPKLRWQWAWALHKLTAKAQDIAVAKAEMAQARAVQSPFAFADAPPTKSSDEKKKSGVTWKDLAGRHSGGDAFKVSDLARIALKAIKGGSKTIDSDNTLRSQDVFDMTGPYLSVQALEATSLTKDKSYVKVSIRSTTTGDEYEIGLGDFGTGKSPIYEADNALLTRERKLHNAYGILPFSPEDPSAYTIHAQVICPSLIGGGVIGECSVDLAAVTPGKVHCEWYTLNPRDKDRGRLQLSVYYERKRNVQTEDSDDDASDSSVAERSTVTQRPKRDAKRRRSSGKKYLKKPRRRKSSLAKDPNKKFTFTELAFKRAIEADSTWNPPTAAAVPPEPSPNALKLVKLREDTTRKLKQARAALEKLKSERDQAVAAQKTAEFKLKRGVSQVKQEEAKAREAEGDAFRGRIFKLKSELKVETDKKLKAERELRTRLRAAKKFYEREKEAKLRAEAKLKEIGEGTQAERDAEKEAEKKIGALRAQVHALEDAKHVVDEKLDEAKHAAELWGRERADLEKKAADAAADAEKHKTVSAGLSNKLQSEHEAHEAAVRENSETLKKCRLAEAEAERVKEALEAAQRDSTATVEESQDLVQRLRSEMERSSELLSALEAEKKRNKEAEQRITGLLAQIAQLKEDLGLLRSEKKQLETRLSEPPPPAPTPQIEDRSLRALVECYTRYFNFAIGKDEDLVRSGVMPLSSVLKGLDNGLLIAAFLNYASPHAIDRRALHVPSGPAEKLNQAQKSENLSVVVASCQGLGVPVARVSDLVAALLSPQTRVREVLDFIFSLICFRLFRAATAERLSGTTDAKTNNFSAATRSPTSMLWSWLRRLSIQALPKDSDLVNIPDKASVGLGTDWADGAIPCTLVGGVLKEFRVDAVVEGLTGSEFCQTVLSEQDVAKRRAVVMSQLRMMGAPAATCFMLPAHLCAAEEGGAEGSDAKLVWSRANILFVAAVADTVTALAPGSGESPAVPAVPGSVGDTEVDGARVWLNNLGVPGTSRVHDLMAELRSDGLLLLRTLEFLAKPKKSVVWKKVEMKPNHKIKCISNLAYAVDVARKDPFNFSLVGVGGNDLFEGNRKLTLSLLWQMRRFQLLTFLKSIFDRKAASAGRDSSSGAGGSAGGGRARASTFSGFTFDEAMVVEWANKLVQSAVAKRGGLPEVVRARLGIEAKVPSITTLHDERLSTSIFYMMLLWSIASWAVNWAFVSDGSTDAKKLLNARYAVAVARKLRVTMFVVPEELVDVKTKTVLVFIGGILALDLPNNGSGVRG